MGRGQIARLRAPESVVLDHLYNSAFLVNVSLSSTDSSPHQTLRLTCQFTGSTSRNLQAVIMLRYLATGARI